VLYDYDWMLQQLATYQSLFHIIIAHAKACHDILTGPGQPEKADVQMHKRKAISLLRKRLLLPRAAFDDGVLLTAVFLSHHSAATGDYAAAELHCQQVYQLMEARGGMKTLEPGTGIRALFEL
jgi:hypothetical protein